MTKILQVANAPITPYVIKLMILKDLDNQVDGRYYDEQHFSNGVDYFMESLEKEGLIKVELTNHSYHVTITHLGKIRIN